MLIPPDVAAFSLPTWESGSLLLNISVLSSALKRGQVFRIEKFQRLEGPSSYSEFISAQFVLVLHWRSYLSTLLTFPLLSPPVHPVMSDKVLQRQDKKRCYRRQWQLALNGNTCVKLVYRHQMKGPFSQYSHFWSKML